MFAQPEKHAPFFIKMRPACLVFIFGGQKVRCARIANEIRMQFRREKKVGPTVSLQESLDTGKDDSALTLSDLLQDTACMEETCEKSRRCPPGSVSWYCCGMAWPVSLPSPSWRPPSCWASAGAMCRAKPNASNAAAKFHRKYIIYFFFAFSSNSGNRNLMMISLSAVSSIRSMRLTRSSRFSPLVSRNRCTSSFASSS